MDKFLRGACGAKAYHRLIWESSGSIPLAGGLYLAYIEGQERFYPIPIQPAGCTSYGDFENIYNDSGPQTIETWISIFDSQGNRLWRKKFGNTRGPTEVKTKDGWLFRIKEYINGNKARAIYIDETGRTVKVTMVD